MNCKLKHNIVKVWILTNNMQAMFQLAFAIDVANFC